MMKYEYEWITKAPISDVCPRHRAEQQAAGRMKTSTNQAVTWNKYFRISDDGENIEMSEFGCLCCGMGMFKSKYHQ